MLPSQTLDILVPAVLAAVLALIPALVELLRTFGRHVRFVLRSSVGWGIFALNAGAAFVTYLLVHFLFGTGNDWLTAVIVGLTFPTLLRSPLTYIKGVETSDAEFKESALHVLANLYDQLLRLAREDADVIQANERVEIAERLAHKHGAAALARQVQWRINALDDETVRTRRQQELDQALAVSDEQGRGIAVALVALDVMPRSTIQEWLRRRKPLEE